MSWRATVLTLFPEMFPGPLGVSLLGKARQKELWSLEVRDIREHGLGKHRTVDDTPAGGGPGMVMRADVACAAIDAVERAGRPLIYLSPRGAAADAGAGAGAGDGSRRDPALRPVRGAGPARDRGPRTSRKSRLGDFVLAGGEIAAMALIEAAVRLIPGVLGADASPEEESFSHGLLEYPQYTRPQSFEGRDIPEVLTGRKSCGNCQMAAAKPRKS